MRRAAFLAALILAASGIGAAAAEPGGARATQPASGLRHPAPVPGTASEPPPHRTGELDCRGCHIGEHQGVVRMYLGTGGRGTPMIPSHMFQVRVECVACHIAPKEAGRRAALAGQTFRPSEQACLTCHGERYRGMLERWTATLGRMREVVAPKLEAARKALEAAGPKHPRAAQAARLVDDAEFNLQFVALGRGVHNVFYAADLLKLANGWLDEAVTLVGRTPPKTDDRLVRGGYCAVLCHEQAGVKQRETVTFGRQKLPHVRHVTEFGATCTACHSPEVHKAVTARPATCTGCHHAPQNERCESCHRAQSAFYRGQTRTTLVKMAPNLMAEAVPCTGCHDWSKNPTAEALGEACLACHERQYLAILPEWTRGFAAEVRQAAAAVRDAEAAVARARRGGQKTPEADALLREAREAVALVRTAGAAHNPLAAGALLDLARDRAQQARARVGAVR